MKIAMACAVAVVIAVSATSPSVAEPAATSPVTQAPRYSTATTPLGDLLDDPAAKAVLEKHIAPMLANEGIQQARGIPLKTLKSFTGGYLTDETLAAIDADLAKLPPK